MIFFLTSCIYLDKLTIVIRLGKFYALIQSLIILNLWKVDRKKTIWTIFCIDDAYCRPLPYLWVGQRLWLANIITTWLIFQSDIDAVDGQAFTALQIVTSGEIKENSLEILKLLLQKKVDIIIILNIGFLNRMSWSTQEIKRKTLVTFQTHT